MSTFYDYIENYNKPDERPDRFVLEDYIDDIDSNDKSIVHFFKNCSPRLNGYYQQTIRGLRSPFENSEQKNLAYRCATPSLEAMRTLAEHYCDKYEIEIEICSVQDLSKMLNHTQRCGLIVTDIDGLGHVVPLLCDFSPEKKNLYSLDVLKPTRIKPLRAVVRGICNSLGYNLREPDSPRSVDSLSCRIQAFIGLRNALIDLKFNRFNPVIKDDLFHIPPAWDYTDQITNPLLKEGVGTDIPIPTDIFRKKQPRTVSAFRQAHTQPILFENRVTFTNSLPIDLTKEKLPDNCQLEGRLTLIWTETKTVNTYIYEKVLKIAGVIPKGPPPSEGPPPSDCQEMDHCTIL